MCIHMCIHMYNTYVYVHTYLFGPGFVCVHLYGLPGSLGKLASEGWT